MDLKRFLDSSPTAWHTANNLAKLLEKAGFQKLDEKSPWKIEPATGYFVTRNESSLLAFLTPKKKLRKAVVAAAHADSPALKLKPAGEFVQEGMTMLSFEVYGSPILPSWIGRDLYLAGRIFYEKSGRVASELVSFPDYPFIISNLALHLDRQVNENGLLVHKQDHLSAIVSSSAKPFLESITKKKLLHHELFAAPSDLTAYLGSEHELLASARLDNLAHAASVVEALLSQKPNQDTLKMLAVWNFEEIGSMTQEGAASSFFEECLERITTHWKLSREEFFCFKARSCTLSCDVTHAVHPNFIDRHDARHRVKLGSGPVIKTNAQARYVTDGEVAATLASLWQKKKINYQYFSSRNDIPCGTTIGPIHSAKTGFKTIDLGIPLLGMHAAREVIHKEDYTSFVKGLSVLFEEL